MEINLHVSVFYDFSTFIINRKFKKKYFVHTKSNILNKPIDE